MAERRLKPLGILKAILIVVPFAIILMRSDPAKLSAALQSLPFWTVPLFVVIVLMRLILQSWRLHILTKLFSNSVGFVELFLLDIKSRYYSTIIPSSVGQDIVRGALLKEHLTADQIVSLSLFYRITGQIPFLLFSFFGLAQLSSRNGVRELMPALIGSTILATLLFVALYSRRVSRYLGQRFPLWVRESHKTFLKKMVIAFQQFRSAPFLVIMNILVSLVAQSLFIFSAMIAVKAITGQWYVAELITFIPVIELLVIFVPFSPNGIGVRELMTVLMFGAMERSHEEMLVFITINSIHYLAGMIGIVPILWEKMWSMNRRKPVA